MSGTRILDGVFMGVVISGIVVGKFSLPIARLELRVVGIYIVVFEEEPEALLQQTKTARSAVMSIRVF